MPDTGGALMLQGACVLRMHRARVANTAASELEAILGERSLREIQQLSDAR